MKPIKLTIIGYLFDGVIYSSREAWEYAKNKAIKAKEQRIFAKVLKSIVREEKIQKAKESLAKFGYSFKRWVSLVKAKAEYFAFKLGLNKKERKLILN